jgi:hypothetical protein
LDSPLKAEETIEKKYYLNAKKKGESGAEAGNKKKFWYALIFAPCNLSDFFLYKKILSIPQKEQSRSLIYFLMLLLKEDHHPRLVSAGH